MAACNLHIKDIKEISRFSSEMFNIDFSGFAYVTLKIKLEQFCDKYRVTSPILLEEKLNATPALKEDYLSYIYFNEFELFRDPALWRCVKDDILSQIKTDLQYRVFFPSCNQGAELLSFLILREELGLVDKIQVLYSSQHKILDQVQRGFALDDRKHHLNLSNYKRIDGHELEDKYFSREDNILVPNIDLFRNTVYFDFKETEGPFKKSVNLVIYRNKLLNFNRPSQVEVASNLIKNIKPGGYLILGVKERLVNDANRELFPVFNSKESIYKKKSNVV